ncbi:osmotically-inducible lipoprotein OsmE [Candidatus Fukatsuia endosymbiont of Tuberolachnus salignus]|uniref:osmotically-inducible lipoprotein OsmE n=2 Tax=Yersiniaceae TaxID=1903411 RepID=UPI00313D717D
MKKVMIVCGVVTLVGCTGFSLIKNFGSEPLVTEASKVGATKQHVLQVGGQPRQSQTIRNGSGTCFDYVLQKEGESTPFYVAFNPQGLVTAGGFTTCNNADQQGLLKAGQPNRQIY